MHGDYLILSSNTLQRVMKTLNFMTTFIVHSFKINLLGGLIDNVNYRPCLRAATFLYATINHHTQTTVFLDRFGGGKTTR